MYASIEDLQNVVLFLKEYFRKRTPDGEALANPYQLVRIVFADGRRWDAATHGLCSRWAMELGGAGAMDAAVSDVDDATQYEQTFHCACSGFVSAWSLRINRLEDVEDAGAASDPEKRYLWECVERRLPSGALSAAIPDPSAPLMAAVAEFKKLARGDRLRYYDYCGGPEHLLDPLDRIEGAFAGGTDSSFVFPKLVAAASRHVRNLYAAANAAR